MERSCKEHQEGEAQPHGISPRERLGCVMLMQRLGSVPVNDQRQSRSGVIPEADSFCW